MTSVKFGGIDTFNLPTCALRIFRFKMGKKLCLADFGVFSIIFYCGGDRFTAAAAAAATAAGGGWRELTFHRFNERFGRFSSPSPGIN
ncbi:hypothetical protein T03_13631 [Trichinella britovi]|uniref:Uncharacterized protein n=1 Tax=Trichinella britovi TaxID=45882 RepID=A0A0V1D066_TRIBR|nr:hypothetical protein T03_13631 [Trichinella britovi]